MAILKKLARAGTDLYHKAAEGILITNSKNQIAV
jgi:hypothetical protein